MSYDSGVQRADRRENCCGPRRSANFGRCAFSLTRWSEAQVGQEKDQHTQITKISYADSTHETRRYLLKI